jgi:phage tail sheath protein FI
MPEYLTPGVYVEEVSFRAPSIEGVGTSTAAFVGPTLTGPVSTATDPQTPELLTSFGDFQNIYGGFGNIAISVNGQSPVANYLALSVQAFFNNGGSQLYVSRVFAPRSSSDLGLASGGVSNVAVAARFPGASGNQGVSVALNATKTQLATVGGLSAGSLLAIVTAPATTTAAPPTSTAAPTTTGAPTTTAAPTTTTAGPTTTTTPAPTTTPLPAGTTVTFYTNGTAGTFSSSSGGTALPSTLGATATLYLLTMQVTAMSAAGSPQVYNGLGFDPAHPNYLGAALGPNPPRPIDQLENQISFTLGGTLTPVSLYQAIFGSTGSPATVAAASPVTYTLSGGDDGLEPQSTDYANALAPLTALEDIAIVSAPGSGFFSDNGNSQNIINALITHVTQQRAYRIAILETPPNQLATENENVRSQIDSSYAALYVPWVNTPNPLSSTGSSIPSEIAVPPSGFIAGIYARNDEQNGVAKAPANEVVLGASSFERNISFGEQGLLNPLGINCLRYFPNRGYRVWGARTASSDSEFQYVNVRRYMIYLEHSIDNSTQWAVFENNGPSLWSRVKESIDSFLYNEWKEGSLLGDSAAQAYFVRCDRTTMTQNDLDNGRMICLIGVAVLKPAEFVIFRIGQMTSGTQG